ncbi:histidine acid phosphatase [Xylariales sp. AK1849]|nr:histidine acid phosphatase [Xylariales sp. AK1849]
MAVTEAMNHLKAWITPASYKYSAVPDGATRNGRRMQATAWTDRNRSIVKLVMGGLVFSIILYFLAGYMRSPRSGSCDTAKDGFQCRADISHFWGPYSPFYTVPSDIPRSTPKDCNVTFVQILSRHGARDPTASKSAIYGSIISRIQNSVTDYGKHYEFIRDYSYTLGADQLTDFGRQEMANSGIKFYKRYEHLARSTPPFVRSAGQYRVVESAQNWTQGFHQARAEDKHSDPSDEYPYDIVVIPEGLNVNNTLSHQLCTAFEQGADLGRSDIAQTTWLNIFAPPITERLNKNLPGAELTDLDTVRFMELCPFNTVADDNGRLSPFCNLFTKDEWHGYDYYESLGKWYGFGNGNPLGSTQGVGFVNELIARLTGRPVEDHTTTNSTLDSSPETFPLDRALYADFSHDNDMAGVFAAMGLYNSTEPLSNTTKLSPKETNGYSASWAVPFASRMYVEKMSCGGSDEESVRILVNDRVIPLQNCDADKLGRCKLGRFVESLSFAREGGHWDMCFR